MSQTVKDVKGVKCKTPAELLKENIARRNNNTEDNLRSYIHQIRLQYSTPTPRNGNCFFEAVSDQLKRLGLPPQNASHLRSNVIAFCKENPILQREDGDVDIKNFVEGDLGGYLDRMSNDGEWADHVMVVYMAEFLKRDILIVTSSPNADPDKNILCINSRTAGEEPLLLGHVWEYHYQSLIPMPETPKLQEEEKNFLRFFLLISLVSPKIIRNYFDTKFPTSSLAQVINQHQQTILDLVRRRVLTVAQEDILRAIPGTKWPPCNRAIAITATSSEDFDLTLMICLLRNIGSIPKPINGWDKLPPTNEKTDGAQLARLKFYRNKLAHATDHKIQTSDFQNQWKEVEEALVDLNGGQHVPEINDVLNYDLDEPNTNLKQELETLKRENMIIEKKMTSAIASEQQTKSEFEHYKTGKLPKNIEEMNKMTIKTWEKEDKPYFETARGIRFMKALHETSLMVVIGNSGNGKTALVRHVALKLKNEDNFEIVPIEFPEQILKYRTNKKQVFVIDDVVGKYSVDLDLLKNWERLNEKLKACINGDNGIKIICTLRKQVAKSNYFASFDSVLAIHQFELDDHLTYDEKRQILLNHYRNSKMPTPLSSEEIDKICENNYAFPLLCKLVNLKARFDNRIRFFEAPYEILNGEFDNLCNHCPNDYFILVVCMLLGGTIEVSEFFSKANGTLLRQASNSCRDDTNIGEIGVRDSLRKMEGTYLTKITTFKYGFIHDKVFESVLSNFALKSPRVMFHVCTFTLIRDHILTAGSRLQFSDGTPLEEDQAIWEVLGNRVLCELEEGRFLNVLLSQIIENVDFVNHLDSLISKKSFNYSYKLLDTEYPFYRDEWRKSDVLLDDIFDQKRNKADLHTINKNAVKFVMSNRPCCKLIYWIVAFGRDNLFHCFWKNLKKSHIETCIRKTLIENLFLFYPVPLLSVAILGGNLKIIKTLIDVGGNGSYYNHLTDGYSQLLQAVQVGSYDIVSILLRRGFSVNEGDLFRETTPLQECALTGNMEILNLLLDNNAQMNTILASGLTSFYNLYDLYLNDTISHDIMSAIVRKDSGNTDLHVAVLNKDRSTVESLMRAGTEHLMTQNNNGQTALHLAALFGEFEIMKLLLEENDSRNKRNILSFSRSFINIGDLNGVRPLHLAVMRNDYDYVDLLLRHKASTFCEDNLRRTPCHFVQCARIANILQPLRFSMRESVDETKDDFEIDEVVVTIEESVGKTRNEDNCESYFKEITEQKNKTRFFCVFNVLRIVFVNVLYLLLPNFTLLNRFVNVANRRDKYGLTPLHAIARMETITINTLCDTFDILIKSGGNIYLQDRRGRMPYQLSRYSFHRSGRFAVLRPKKTYLRFQGFMLTVLFVLFFSTAIVMIKWNNVYFNRNISRPNNQHKCEVAKGRKYNDTLNVYNEFTISQQSLSKPFEVILPILLFSIPYFVLSRRLYIVPLIGKKFTMYFVGVQVLKLVCFTILILSNVYCSSNLTGWFLNFPFWQFSLIYFFHTDFRLLWYLQITADGIEGVLRKQFAILATTLYYFVWLIVFMTQIYKIELSSSRWEILVNCSRPVHENSSMYKCQYGSNDVVIHLLSEQNNTYTVSQYNTCSGTKTANEMMVDDILFNIYSSLLGFVCLLCIFYQTEIGYCLSCLSHPNIWIKCISSYDIYRCIFWKIGASWPFAANLMWVSMIGIVQNIRFFFCCFMFLFLVCVSHFIA